MWSFKPNKPTNSIQTDVEWVNQFRVSTVKDSEDFAKADFQKQNYFIFILILIAQLFVLVTIYEFASRLTLVERRPQRWLNFWLSV